MSRLAFPGWVIPVGAEAHHIPTLSPPPTRVIVIRGEAEEECDARALSARL